jgi:uncharacterized protein (UPF0332 family)
MIFKRLEERGIIEPIPVNKEEINAILAVAMNDLKMARTMLDAEGWDWAHNIAYNAVKQACLGLMNAYGYRPIGEAKHKNILVFAKEILDAKFKADVARADKMRKERNVASYEAVGTITEQKAKGNLEFAERFTKEIIGITEGLLREE